VSSPTPAIVLAHGFGGRGDLPVPFSLALAGAGIAVVASFVLAAWSWPVPRFEDPDGGRPLPLRVSQLLDASWTRWAIRAVGLIFAAYVAVAAWFGPDILTNPTFGVVYVWLWVGLVPLSLLFGPVWRLLNPLRPVHLALARLLRVSPTHGLVPLPAGLGTWPAAVGLFAFVWLELVAPGAATLPVVRLWFTAYAVITVFGALVFGRRWFDCGDPFEVYSRLFGRLSVLARRPSDRRFVLRNPLAHLAMPPDGGYVPGPGAVAVVVVLLGSTAYDGVSQSTGWVGFVQRAALPEALLGTGALICFILLAAVTYWSATVACGWLAPARGVDAARRLPGAFAGSVVPIALGYLVAHYFTLFVLEGQRTLALLSDPLSTGADLFGLADYEVHAGLVNDPQVVALVKIGAVVVGHILGVVAAHDRAVALFSRREALLGQIPLLVVMVGYTLGGLTLLFAT
jgi:hypothetical protein